MSGLERRLQRLYPNIGIPIHNQFSKLSSYADDFKLFGSSLADINTLFSGFSQYLRYVGLECLAKDCAIMIVNGSPNTTVHVDGTQLVTCTELRFLGVLINHLGNFLPTKTDYSKALWALFKRVQTLGLSSYPTAYIKAY